MLNLKKNVFALIFIFSFILFLTSPLFIQAAERELEVDYPEIGEWWPERIEEGILPPYIRYIFYLALAISGLVVFGVLISGGVRWLTSAGNPAVLKDAQDQILAAFLGIIILLSSWLILTTIDPQLVVLKLPKLLRVKATEMPGVYLSSEAVFPSDQKIKDNKLNVYHKTFSVADLRDMGVANVNSLKLVNQLVIEKEEATKEQIEKKPDFYYGVVLHEKINMEGQCVFHRSVGLPEKPFNNISLGQKKTPLGQGAYEITPIGPRSITVFQEVKTSEGEVIVYSKPEFEGDSKKLKVTDPLKLTSTFESLAKLSEKVQSIKIDGSYLLVLRGAGRCAVFDKSISIADLKGYSINKCLKVKPGLTWPWNWFVYDPCATHYALFPIYR